MQLLEILRCPFCRSELRPDGDALDCSGCGRTFGRAPDGIPLMLHRELPRAPEKLREAEGWLEKARTEGWYEPDDTVDAVLPFVNRELGWNDSIGLGRGAFYGEFGRVQADGENLPFDDETFDVTYCVATLHHALDLSRMVREMARVTRHGGIVAGLNEGTRGLGRSADNPEQAGEKELGINEHVHTVWAYFAAFVRAGVTVRLMERSDGRPPVPFGSFLSRMPKIGMTLGTLAHLSVYPYAGVSTYGRRR